jgi:small subunit ribosomal protein S9
MTESATKFTGAIGRRKSAIAQVRLHHGGQGVIEINKRAFEQYLPTSILRQAVQAPLVLTGTDKLFDIRVVVKGGGMSGQADSIRLGIARALVDFNPEFRSVLKKQGFLTRDARIRERKKFGKKSARRSPQWSKR